MLAGLYALYAFGYALKNPTKAPAVTTGGSTGEVTTSNERLIWFVAAPVAMIGGLILLSSVNVIGSQNIVVESFTDTGQAASLRPNVSEQCQASMIELHGQAAWDAAIQQQLDIDAAGGAQESRALTPEEQEQIFAERVAAAAPVGSGLAIAMVFLALMMTTARGVAPSADARPLWIGLGGVALTLLINAVWVTPTTTAGIALVKMAIPIVVALYGAKYAAGLLGRNELLRVVFPPLVLIVAVLGSILGGITNPTPAAALGAGGAILLAAYRKLRDEEQSGKLILQAAFAIVIMLLIGVNFDLRINQPEVSVESWIAFFVAYGAYLFAMFGILYSCWVLFRSSVLSPVVRETAKVTSLVFTILIGSQILNLEVISFVGEHYIQQFLRSFD